MKFLNKFLGSVLDNSNGQERRTDSLVSWSKVLTVHNPPKERKGAEMPGNPTPGHGTFDRTFVTSFLCHLTSAYSPFWFKIHIYHLPLILPASLPSQYTIPKTSCPLQKLIRKSNTSSGFALTRHWNANAFLYFLCFQH